MISEAEFLELEQRRARLERYLSVDPRNLSILGELVDVCLAQSQIVDAANYVQMALKINSSDLSIRSRHGLVLMERGLFYEAGQLFEELLKETSDLALATNLGFAYSRQGRHQETIEVLAPYIHLPDVSSEAITLYLRALHHKGNLKLAVEVVEDNAARLSGDRAFVAAASLVYLDNENIEKAREMSEAALIGDVRPLEAVVVCGTLALNVLDAQNATSRFEEAVTINPSDGRSWSGLGLASLLMQDTEHATAQLEKAVEYMPEHIGTIHALGWCRILACDLGSAHTYFDRALKLDRNFSESHGGLAVVYALRGENRVAEESIARALRLDSKCLSARFAQMAISGALRDPDKFRSIVFKILSRRESADGTNMADMLTRFMSR